MTYDYSSLNGAIVEKFGTQYKFSKAMNLSERTISLKLNGISPWKSNEIMKVVELLDIDVDEIPRYFFKIKVHDYEQI